MDIIREAKMRNAVNIGIIILVVVIYTFYQWHNADGISVTVGVDDSKIGIAVDDQTPVFISLADVQDVIYTEDFDAEAYPDAAVYASGETGAYVIITTPDAMYVVNTSTKKATKTIYEEIAAALPE